MLKNWIPYHLEFNNSDVYVHWLNLEDRFIEEPFFDETITNNKIIAKNKKRKLSISDLICLVEWASTIDSCQTSCFIFHVSRCGSTLLSQCLAVEKKYVSIPEAPLLDQILSLEEHLLPPGILKEQLFKSVLHFYGQKRLGQQGLFIKLDSWHLHQYETLRAWFPNTPFYFLSREPNAIIHSHEKRRGIQMIPGYLSKRANPILIEDRHYRDFSLFTADVLESFYEQLICIANHKNKLDRFYDYSLGMEKMLKDFDEHMHTDLYTSDKVIDRLNKHSKYPEQKFVEDSISCDRDFYRHSMMLYLQFYSMLWNKEMA